MGIHQIAIFKVSEFTYGVDIANVNQIINIIEIFKVPNTPSFIAGLINLRGKVYTIVDFRIKVDVPLREFDEYTKIILINYNDKDFGLLVDEVSEILKINDENIDSSKETVAKFGMKYTNAIGKYEDKTIALLDIESVIALL